MFGINDPNDSQVVTIPEELPVLPLRNMVALPFTTLPIAVGVPRSVRLVQEAMQSNRLLALVTSHDPDIDEPTSEQVHDVGSVALIQRIVRGENNTLQLVVNVLERVKVQEWTSGDPYLRARVTVARDIEDDETPEAIALRRTLLQVSREVVELMPNLPDEVGDFLEQVEENRLLVYMIGANARMELEQRQQLLELDDVNAKMRLLIDVLTQEREVLAIGQRISQETQQKVGKEQREFILRRQMDAIRKELGEVDDEAAEAEAYREKIEKAGLPTEAFEQANRELKRLERLSAQSAEYGVIKTYLDWMVELPWNTFSEDNLDIDNARRVLDEDHYDLKTVKDRILEFLAVRKLAAERAIPAAPAAPSEPGENGGAGENADPAAERPTEVENEARGAILLFVGPPGVGKTSLAKSIARALGREFTRMSLGGMRDEAEIRGHRRTYIGAMPGRIIQAIKRAKTRNPVFVLDEIDKIGQDWRGDPASALLEVLDPQQNNAFRDHYMDVDFDLSDVIFITTANQIDTIPGPLLDRMEVIQLDGYTEYEKVKIAQEHLLARQLKANSLRPDEIGFNEEALRKIIREYTREAGVRNLEREIGSVLRKAAVHIAAGDATHIDVTPDLVREYLGKPRFKFEAGLRTEVPGVATGMAWTPVGGDVLFVEATRSRGRSNLTITGQLGK
ncbi:MAG: endopeptidase La, partial [Anaerolineae bacterium]|nr:endopeptidase La [Anaerolineae bacterium]